MDYNRPQNNGALFARNKKTQNGPDCGGDITISGEVLQYVMAKAGNGEVKLELSGWRRMGRNGTAFTSLKVNIPYADRGNAHVPPQYNRGPNTVVPMQPRGSVGYAAPQVHRAPQTAQNRPPQQDFYSDPIPFGNDPDAPPF